MCEAYWYDENVNRFMPMAALSNQGGQVQPAVCRIWMPILDRAREGLRIIEEWCRFGLIALVEGECKQPRQELAGTVRNFEQRGIRLVIRALS